MSSKTKEKKKNVEATEEEESGKTEDSRYCTRGELSKVADEMRSDFRNGFDKLSMMIAELVDSRNKGIRTRSDSGVSVAGKTDAWNDSSSATSVDMSRDGQTTQSTQASNVAADQSPLRIPTLNDLNLSSAKVHTVKSFKGLLKNATPSEIVTFKQEVEDYQSLHEDVKVGYYIKADLVTSLIFKLELKINRNEFLILSNEVIFKMLFQFSIPETPSEWCKVFQRSVKLAGSRERYQATATNFDKLYADTQIFITSFREIYRFMIPQTRDQIKLVVPPFMGTSKLPGGSSANEGAEGTSMVALFVELCPGGFGKEWNRLIFPYGLREVVREVNNVDTYLDYILKRLLELKTLSVKLRPLADILDKSASKHVYRASKEAGIPTRERVNQLAGSWNSDDESSCESDLSYSSCSSKYNSDIDDDEQDIQAMAADQASRPCFKLANKGHCDGMNNGKLSFELLNLLLPICLTCHQPQL